MDFNSVHPKSFFRRHVLKEEYLSSIGDASFRSFNYSSNVWIFLDRADTDSEATLLWMRNLRHFTRGYTIRVLRSENYQEFLTPERLLQTEEAVRRISRLKGKLRDSDRSDILSRVIALSVLLENGGILISEDTFLTEQLSWVETSPPHHYATLRSAKPHHYATLRSAKGAFEVFGFLDGQNSTAKESVRFSFLSSGLLAARPNSLLIERTLDNLVDVVLKADSYTQLSIRFSDAFEELLSRSDYAESAFKIASLIALS